MTVLNGKAGAVAIAALVRSGATSATAVAEAALARIALRNPVLNAFTSITTERAMSDARRIDAKLGRGEDPGPWYRVRVIPFNRFVRHGMTIVP